MKKYEEAIIEVIKFSAQDVITDSCTEDLGCTDDSGSGEQGD